MPDVSDIRKVDLFRGRPTGGRGYLLIDNRVSGGTLFEANTLTCSHCNCMVVINPERIRERGWCARCNAYVCDAPTCASECYAMQRCIALMMDDPTIPALPRTKDGGLLFDPELLRKTQF